MLIFMAKGLPGSGKSTTMRILSKILNCETHNSMPCWVNQDEVKKVKFKLSGKTDKQKFCNWIKLLMESQSPYIFIDKINLSFEHRDAIYKLNSNLNYQIILLNFDIPLNICLNRIMVRKGHHNLTSNLGYKKINGILHSLKSQEIDMTVDELTNFTKNIDIMDDKIIDIICNILNILELELKVDIEDIEKAYNESIEYENKLKKLPLYAGLFFDLNKQQIKQISKYIDQLNLDLIGLNLKPVKDPHITCQYTGSKKELDKDILLNLNKEYTVIMKGFAINHDNTLICAYFDIPNDLICYNDHPHMTMLLANGTKPFTSNEVLANNDSFRLDFDEGIEMIGRMEIR
jgi:predicted kinase